MRGGLFVVLPLLVGCGAKTGLLVDDLDASTSDAAPDTFEPFDTHLPPIDVGTDGPFVRDCSGHDFCFEIPLGRPPTPDRAIFGLGTAIKAADIAFVMDTTGSMEGAIGNLRKALSETLFPALEAAIPSVRLAVVDHRDYPVSPYGTAGTDYPVRVHVKMTSDVALAQGAASALMATGGGDGPEAQIPAMVHTLTGKGLSWPGGSFPAHSPAPGTFGGVEFHPGALPVVVEITDIDWHGTGHVPYSFAAPDMPELIGAFKAVNARFVSITLSTYEAQPDQLSDETGSSIVPSAFLGKCGAGMCCTGISGTARPPKGPGGRCRLNFLHSGGTGVGDHIVTAIAAISVGSVFDMTAVAYDDPTNPGGVDATKFIKALRAVDEGDASKGCEARAAKDTDGDGVKDTFTSVPVGTHVCFEVIPKTNDSVVPTDVKQFFHATIVVLGMPGSIVLESKSALFIVPAKKDGG